MHQLPEDPRETARQCNFSNGLFTVGRAYMRVEIRNPRRGGGVGGECIYQTGRQKLIIFLHSEGCWNSSVAFLGGVSPASM